MTIADTFVASHPVNDDKVLDADDDDEECDDSTDEDSGRNERRAINSRYSYERDDEHNEEESIHSMSAETRARINKEWDEWVWGDVTDFHPDHLAAFRGPFWDTEGVWTTHWESSNSGPSNDNIAPRAKDGLKCLKGLGLNVEGLDRLEFLDNLVVQAVDGGGGTVGRHDCARFKTQKPEASTLWYDPNCVT